METIRWQDNPDHKNLYDAEVDTLTNGIDGEFELIGVVAPDASGRITATGWLKFRDQEKQVIRIIFPTKYPYTQPIVFPLKQNVDGSIGSESKLFGKGNQYANGAMCLMLRNQWDQREHTIGWILRRSQKWLFSVTSPEGFKKEEIIDEIPATIAHQGQVILPKDIPLPNNLNSGILILTKYKNNHYILEQNFISESPFSLDQGKESFRWFRIKAGVMLKDIYSPDINTFINNMHQYGVTADHIIGKNFALYIPDDPNPWHFFKVPVINGNQIHVIYFISRNVEKELYHRITDVFDDSILKKKKVTIIGLGAVGSEVARSLARNGIGHFNLFDNDTFEIGNSVRHAADIFFIGENKAFVAKQLIMRSNPNISVNAYPIDILDDAGLLEQSLAQSDLCIVLTADDNVDYLINNIYVPRYPIQFLFARVSSGGLSGSVQVVQFSKTACLRCLSLHEADILPIAKNSKRYGELSPEYGSCSSPAVAGSEIDTKEVALQASRISMQLLLENDNCTYAKRLGDQFYWHGPFGSTSSDPFTWQILKLQKHTSCELCNP